MVVISSSICNDIWVVRYLQASSGFPGLMRDGIWSAGGIKRSMYTEVAAARVGKRPPGVAESQVCKPLSRHEVQSLDPLKLTLI